MNTVLHNHVSSESAYVIKNYPYGSLRTDMKIWIEKGTRGQNKNQYRVCTQTLNPKNGRWNNVHYGIYHDFIILYLNDTNNHVEHAAISIYTNIPKFVEFKNTWYSQFNEEEKQLFNKLEKYSKLLNPTCWTNYYEEHPAKPECSNI